ncbi:MAG TPA: pyridoxal-phosphate dependent enzyme, partial [Actinomycetota bacterium]
PNRVVACVGGGSNAIGTFTAFVADRDVELVGVEAAGEGLASGRHGASLGAGREGVLHGTFSSILQDADGQILEAHSVSAGLDYPGVGPEHAFWLDSGRVAYRQVGDAQALEGFRLLARTEGLLPALEPAHAVAWLAGAVAVGEVAPGSLVLLNLSGRGDKDVEVVAGLVEVGGAGG